TRFEGGVVASSRDRLRRDCAQYAFPGADLFLVLRPAAHRIEAQSDRHRHYRARCQWWRLRHRDHPRRRAVYSQGTNRGRLRTRTAQRAGIPLHRTQARASRDLPLTHGAVHHADADLVDLFGCVRLRTDIGCTAHRKRHLPQLRGVLLRHLPLPRDLMAADVGLRDHLPPLPLLSDALRREIMTPHFGLPEFGFLLRGLQWTVLLTLVAFVGG